ncbi:hypothetical protein PR048_015061 [Dryococelus australis]|uniref:Uncharacterized protein n=1 Tax=Dryococelus australis TaxID=614101 RepID=A0ABQ9HGE7_9NEOP|nr:hypothetical protein PR048_015061 [Dryococelus australis]
MSQYTTNNNREDSGGNVFKTETMHQITAMLMKCVRGEQLQWHPGPLVEVVSQVTYRVKVGGMIRFCHRNHLQPSFLHGESRLDPKEEGPVGTPAAVPAQDGGRLIHMVEKEAEEGCSAGRDTAEGRSSAGDSESGKDVGEVESLKGFGKETRATTELEGFKGFGRETRATTTLEPLRRNGRVTPTYTMGRLGGARWFFSERSRSGTSVMGQTEGGGSINTVPITHPQLPPSRPSPIMPLTPFSLLNHPLSLNSHYPPSLQFSSPACPFITPLNTPITLLTPITPRITPPSYHPTLLSPPTHYHSLPTNTPHAYHPSCLSSFIPSAPHPITPLPHHSLTPIMPSPPSFPLPPSSPYSHHPWLPYSHPHPLITPSPP